VPSSQVNAQQLEQPWHLVGAWWITVWWMNKWIIKNYVSTIVLLSYCHITHHSQIQWIKSKTTFLSSDLCHWQGVGGKMCL
jgi:hypothetical protein